MNTLLDHDRLEIIKDLVKRTSHLAGDMAEIGVYKGGSSRVIATTDPNRMLYSCDTFEGLPQEDSSIDLHHKGDFNDTSFEEVKKFLNLPNIIIIKGFFPDPTLHQVMYNSKFSFVHLDVDLYQCTKECLEFFYDRLVPGGILVSDDYLWKNCPGVKKAFDEFMEGKPETLVNTEKLSCYFVKK